MTNAAAGSAGPELAAFRAGDETRLRDLLAFALAAEAGRPVAAGAIEDLRRKADAELHDHAFCLLHNSIDQIRREAAAEEKARHRPPMGFWATLAANLLALGIVAGLAWLMLRHPELLPPGL